MSDQRALRGVLRELARQGWPHRRLVVLAFASMLVLGATTGAYAYLTGPALRFLLTGGEEGLGVLRSHPRGIDVVVLDVTMPGMGGLEAARALRGVRPDLPVVLMSGYSVREVTLRSAGLGITGFVQKPFATPDLLAAVRLALGQ